MHHVVQSHAAYERCFRREGTVSRAHMQACIMHHASALSHAPRDASEGRVPREAPSPAYCHQLGFYVWELSRLDVYIDTCTINGDLMHCCVCRDVSTRCSVTSSLSSTAKVVSDVTASSLMDVYMDTCLIKGYLWHGGVCQDISAGSLARHQFIGGNGMAQRLDTHSLSLMHMYLACNMPATCTEPHSFEKSLMHICLQHTNACTYIHTHAHTCTYVLSMKYMHAAYEPFKPMVWCSLRTTG